MEHIVRERIYPQAPSQIPRLRLSPLLLIVFSVVVGFAVVTISVRAVAQYTPSPPDPFPDYADIFPGQPASAIETRTFSCEAIYNYNHDLTKDTEPMQELCTFIPAEGVFSSVEASLSGGIIYQLTFIMRDNTLQVGDLAQLLGMPPIHRFKRTAYFLLPTSLVRADPIGQRKRFSLFLPVWSITFMKLS